MISPTTQEQTIFAVLGNSLVTVMVFPSAEIVTVAPSTLGLLMSVNLNPEGAVYTVVAVYTVSPANLASFSRAVPFADHVVTAVYGIAEISASGATFSRAALISS